MKILIVTWASPTHYFPMVPLGRAFLAAGHDVRVATQPALADVVLLSGLPAAVIGHDVDVIGMVRAARRSPELAKTWRSPPYLFGQYLTLAAAMVDDLIELARTWRPDLMVYEPTTYAAPLAAAVAGVPAARHLWGPDVTYRLREIEGRQLMPLCRRLGLEGVETLGALTLDPCPPSMQVRAAYRRQVMRYVPYNGGGVVDPALTGRPGRPRVCLTRGTTLARLGEASWSVAEVSEALAELDLDVVAAVSDAGAEFPAPLPANISVVESVPLQLLLPTCDVLVHQGGAGTMLTGLALGVPQLIIPASLPEQQFHARQLLTRGAGLGIAPWRVDRRTVRAHVAELLGKPSYRDSAQRLRQEIEQQPALSEVVEALADPAAAPLHAPGPA